MEGGDAPPCPRGREAAPRVSAGGKRDWPVQLRQRTLESECHIRVSPRNLSLSNHQKPSPVLQSEKRTGEAEGDERGK